MNKQKVLTGIDIIAGYDKKIVLHKVSFDIYEKETVAFIGPNGSGKSTLIKTIFGIIKPKEGKLFYKEKDITGRSPYDNSKDGISYFVQGGEIFTTFSVVENLLLPQYIDNSMGNTKELLNEIYTIFPEIKRFKDKRAGVLSGGERQMLALGILLMKKPKVLLLDEPLSKLAPIWKDRFIHKITELKKKWELSIIFWAEQDIPKALSISDRIYLMKLGKIELSGPPEKIKADGILEEIYFK